MDKCNSKKKQKRKYGRCGCTQKPSQPFLATNFQRWSMTPCSAANTCNIASSVSHSLFKVRTFYTERIINAQKAMATNKQNKLKTKRDFKCVLRLISADLGPFFLKLSQSE